MDANHVLRNSSIAVDGFENPNDVHNRHDTATTRNETVLVGLARTEQHANGMPGANFVWALLGQILV